MSLYKFNPFTLRWFESYLDCRQQAIQREVGLTGFAEVRAGVPQGSILGPTLFLLFINDLPLHLEACTSDIYADDTTIHTNHKQIDTVEIRLQGELNNSNDWSKENKLPLNLKKTTCMTLGTRMCLSNCRELNLQVNDIRIQNVTTQKLLGVYIDENLTWSKHIDHLCSVVSSKISLLKHLAEYVPIDVQKRFYQGYILPLIDYGSVTWGSTSCTNLERLAKLQKRAARIILKADFDTPSSLMFRDLNWLSVEKRVKYNKAVLTYRALNNMAPEYI